MDWINQARNACSPVLVEFDLIPVPGYVVLRQNAIRAQKGHGLGCSEQFSMRVAAEEEVLGGYGLLRRRALAGGEGPSGTLLPPFILNSD